MNSSAEGPVYLSTKCLLNPQDIVLATQNFTSWIIWGSSREPSAFLNTSTELAVVLLRHGQYDAVEVRILPFTTLEPFTPFVICSCFSDYLILTSFFMLILFTHEKSTHVSLTNMEVQSIISKGIFLKCQILGLNLLLAKRCNRESLMQR